jgi:hypothetical protein
MLQVSPDSVVLAACCAAAPRFINVNPVMSVVIKVKAFWRFLLPSQPRLGQTKLRVSLGRLWWKSSA